DRSQSVEVPARGRITAPHDRRTAGGSRPARALKPDDVAPFRGSIRRAVVVGRIAIVHGAAVEAAGRARVERGVLAEVLHPAVVVVVDGVVEQRFVEAPAGPGDEVELTDVEDP